MLALFGMNTDASLLPPLVIALGAGAFVFGPVLNTFISEMAPTRQVATMQITARARRAVAGRRPATAKRRPDPPEYRGESDQAAEDRRRARSEELRRAHPFRPAEAQAPAPAATAPDVPETER